MSLQNTSYTLKILRDAVIDRNNLNSGETNITDQSLIRAVNAAISIIQRIEQKVHPENHQAQTGALSVDSAGYDLSNITDCGSYTRGFFVYQDEINPYKFLPKRDASAFDKGYYILGNKLYLTRAEGGTVYIVYQKKTTRIDLSIDVESNTDTLPFDQDLEEAVENFVASRFYEREKQGGDEDIYKQAFYAEVERFFDEGPECEVI